MVRAVTPGTETLIVPVRVVVPVLAVVLILNEPLPVRFVGDTFVTVSHDVLLLVGAFHVALDVTLILMLSAPCGADHVVCDTVSVGPACTTEIVRVGAPGAVTVTVPLLRNKPAFAVALILNEPSPVRFAGTKLLNVNHATLLDTDHVLFELTFTVAALLAAPGVHPPVDNVRVGVGAACVTVIVRGVKPVTETVIVAVLAAVPVLVAVLIMKEPLPVRFAGRILVIANHVALLETVHCLFEATLTVPRLEDAVGFHVLGDMPSVGTDAAWVTVINRVDAPGAVTVIVPVLGTVPALAVALILNEPLPVRFAGTKLLNVNHVTLLETLHVLFDVTLIVALLAGDCGLHAAADKLSVPPPCVTVIVRVGALGAVTVTVALLDAPVFVATLIRNEPLLVRLVGTKLPTTNHDALLDTVHVLFEVTFTVTKSEAAFGVHVLRDNVSVAAFVVNRSISS